MRIAGGAVVVGAALLVLTGCGSKAAPSTYTPTVTVAPTATATVTATPTPTPVPTRSASSAPEPGSTPSATRAAADPDRPKGQCDDDALGVSVVIDPGGGGAGSSYYDVLFTNTGGETCVLRGAPGVSVVSGDGGAQVGAPADRNQAKAGTVRLPSGETASALLKVTNIAPDGGPLDGCTVRKGRGYRVYPPHSTRAFFVPDTRAVACAGDGPVFMGVDTVKAQ